MMKHPIEEIFKDENLIKKIQVKLPKLFQIAELESQRAGKTGMEVGSVRERILVALLIHKFGEENVNTEIPITETETDVIIKGFPLSIKTKTGKSLSGIKSVWTVDHESIQSYLKNYKPQMGMLLAQINWNDKGYLFFIPLETQTKIYESFGSDRYFKVYKSGTNPRGVEFAEEAMDEMIQDKSTKSIIIDWQKENINYNPFNRWVELWAQE
ncbi:ThaI family type II restriction endonuclease [Ignavibacterium sp.]|uniref:ThaI family type II restriction endonuclease n=1 Tax=Ignavibacterium TaxID=795750 RepID=UPI0025BD6118|nr:ThaI family type II restriction endonuclease [Ignavibacterium sp.]